MLIIGAKGLAKEVLEILHQRNELENIHFYDDVTANFPDYLYGSFPVLKKMDSVLELFKKDNRFIIGIGNPKLRFQMYDSFKTEGGSLISAISPLAQSGHYGTTIGVGAIVMAGTVITNDVTIGINCLINPNCTISHDTVIGDFVEISPGVQITGHCQIGDYCNIGTNAILLPKIKLGNWVTVGAGAVVNKNVTEGRTVVGVPAKELNKL